MPRQNKRQNPSRNDVGRMPLVPWSGWSAGVRRAHPEQAGIGGVIHDPSGTAVAVFSEAIGHVTVDVAKWAALNRLIETAADCGTDALVVSPDSELIAAQYNGVHAGQNQHTATLLNQVQAAVQHLPGRVDIHCAEQGADEEARALTIRAASIPLLHQNNRRIAAQPWTPIMPRNCAEWPDDPAVGEFGHDEPRLGRLRKLRVAGGHDSYSNMADVGMRDVVAEKWGKQSLLWMLSALGWSSRKHYGRTALRWAARGLAPPVALKKASVDTEITRAQSERNMRDHYRDWMLP